MFEHFVIDNRQEIGEQFEEAFLRLVFVVSSIQRKRFFQS